MVPGFAEDARKKTKFEKIHNSLVDLLIASHSDYFSFKQSSVVLVTTVQPFEHHGNKEETEEK